MPGFGVRLTRVVTAADPAWSLVTVKAFKAELGVVGATDDSFIASLATQATAAIARHCNRGLAPQTLADTLFPTAEPYPWQVPVQPGPIGLTGFPLIGAPAIVADGVALIEGVDVTTDGDLGLVHRLDAGGRPTAWTAGTIVATYAAGFATVPPDLADAATRLMKARWFARARDPGVRAETIPEVISRTFWFGSGPGSSGALPPDVEGLLAPFRLPVMA